MDIDKLKEHLYDVIGAIHEVNRELGPGLNESCYQEALQMELQSRNIAVDREVAFHPSYRGVPMESLFRIDFLCKGDIIIECKAVQDLQRSHRAQLFNYMRLLEKPCGLLVNFYPSYAVVERYFYDSENRCVVGVNGQLIR